MFQPDEKNGLRNILILWVILFTSIWALLECSARAAPAPSDRQYSLGPIGLEKLNLEWERLDASSRDAYVPEYTGQWRERAALDWRVNVLGALYWDNWIHTETIQSGEVKTVGWKWEAGIRVTNWLELFQSHHSRHVMDVEPRSRDKFPVDNGTGFRIRWIPETSGRSIWK